MWNTYPAIKPTEKDNFLVWCENSKGEGWQPYCLYWSGKQWE